MDVAIVGNSIQNLSISDYCNHKETTAYGKAVSKTETLAFQTSAKEGIIPYVEWLELYHRTASIVTPRFIRIYTDRPKNELANSRYISICSGV